MIFLKCDETSKVNYIHYMPFDGKHGLGKTQEQLEQEGVLVDSIPEPQIIEGKNPIMYYSKEKGIFYEYEDIPKSKEELQSEEIKNLKQQLAQCQQSITELTALASTMLAPK